MNLTSRLGFVIISLLFYMNASGQFWVGYETGRFTGISSANIRPGGMAPSPYKVDATLFGIHLNQDPKTMFTQVHFDQGSFKDFAGFSQLTSNRTHVFTNLQGPSILVAATPKVSVAFSWNVRYMWLSEMSEPKITRLFDKESTSLDLTGDNETTHILFTGWNEFGLGAGGEVFKEDFNSFSVGGFAKLVYGTGHMSTNSENMSIRSSGDVVQSMSMSMQADISDNLYEFIDDGDLKFVDRLGFGFDLGAEYKHLNPRSCPGASNYMLNVGFSLTDIGKVRYNSVSQYDAPDAAANNVPLDSFRSETFRGTVTSLENIFNVTSTTKTDFSVMLPMSLRLYSAYNIRRRGIIYGELQVMFVQFTNPELPVFIRGNITPRFEDDRFGVYIPLTFTNYVPANAGLAIRLKPLIIGSENLFTFWAYGDRGTTLDLYVTVKIPILHDSERIDWKTMGKRLSKNH